jgi:hypothetical protein
MKKLIENIVGMRLIDYQTIYSLNFKDIQTIIKIHQNHFKHY